MQVASKEGRMGVPTPSKMRKDFCIAERGHRNKKEAPLLLSASQ